MRNATIYCLCLHNKVLPIMKNLGYVPVGLGNNKFSKEWTKDNTFKNISSKNKYYSEYTFHYWFWKNILPKIEDNHWIGFCAYRDYWSKKKEISNDIYESFSNDFQMKNFHDIFDFFENFEIFDFLEKSLM